MGKRINLQPLIKESIIITKHDSQEKQKIEQDQKQKEISVGRDNQNKMKDFSKKDVKNTSRKFHSPNQTIPSFTGWKRVNLQPLNTAVNQPAKNQLTTESVTITTQDSQEKQKIEQDQKQEEISVGRDNQNKMKEFSKEDVKNTYKKFHSPNQTIPNFIGWKRVNLQPLNTAVNQPVKNQPVTESITKHN